MENVITVQEHPEHVRTANDANTAVWRPEQSQGLLERSTRRVPEQRLFIRRVGRVAGLAGSGSIGSVNTNIAHESGAHAPPHQPRRARVRRNADRPRT
jgi:hypothetical protein